MYRCAKYQSFNLALQPQADWTASSVRTGGGPGMAVIHCIWFAGDRLFYRGQSRG